MPSLESLPQELVLLVLKGLDSVSDCNSFALTCSWANNIMTPYLYQYAVENIPGLLLWASEFGRTGTARNLLREGADPNGFYSIRDGSRIAHLPPSHWDPLPNPRPFLNALYYSNWGPSPRVDNQELRNNYSRHFFCFPLHLAARRGHDEMIELLLDCGADIDSLSSKLCWCSGRPVFLPGNIHNLNRFRDISSSSDCDCCQSQQSFWTPLHVALCHGHESTAMKLVARGASLEFEHIPHRTTYAIHTAAKSECIEFIKYLLDKHPEYDIDQRDSFGYTPLHWAFTHLKTIHFLQWRGANIDAMSSSFGSLLHLCCCLGQFDAAEFFLESGAAVNARFELFWLNDWYWMRPIDICCAGACLLLKDHWYQDVFGFVKKLVQWGASLEACPGSQISPAAFAVANRSKKTLEFLRGTGVDFSCEDRVIEQSLITKSSDRGGILPDKISQITFILDWLLAHGAPMNFSDGRVHQRLEILNKSVSDDAMYRILRDLLKHGLDPNLIYNGKILFWPLYCHRALTCCQLLLRYGTDPCHVHSIFDLITMSHQAPTPPEGEPEYYRRWRLVGNRNPTEDLKFLLECDVNKVLLKEPRTLVTALQRQRIRLAQTLLDAGDPDVTGVSEDGRGCLHHLVASAVSNKRKTYLTMEKILQLGADPNFVHQQSGMSPLYLALSNDKWAFSRLLIQYGARTDNVTPALNSTDHHHHHPDVFLWGLRNVIFCPKRPRDFNKEIDFWYKVTLDQNSFAMCTRCQPSHSCMLCPVATLQSRVGHLLEHQARAQYEIDPRMLAQFIASLCSTVSS